MNLTTWEGEKTVYDLYFDAAVFFICREALSATLKKQGMIYFYCSLALSLRQNCIPANMSQLSLSCALAARDANERAKRERERSEVVVGRYAHHKFYFCRETDGLKTNRARKLLNLCDFFSPFFCDNFATKTNHGIVWAMYSVSVSRYFFCFIFSRFLPFKCSFYKYLRLCEWGDFLNAFYRR